MTSQVLAGAGGITSGRYSADSSKTCCMLLHALCYWYILLVLLFMKFCTWSASCLVAVGVLSLALMLYSPADDGWLVVVNWWWLAHQPSSRRWWST
jgi:hypothetical protein